MNIEHVFVCTRITHESNPNIFNDELKVDEYSIYAIKQFERMPNSIRRLTRPLIFAIG